MNITDFLIKYRKPLFAPEGEGGSGGGADAAAAGGAPETALGGDAPGGAGAAADADGAAASDTGADASDEGGEGETADKDKAGDGDDAAAGEFKLTAPEGMENFQGEFDAYSSEASEWMQANPNATASEALSWAADRQAAAVAKQTQDMSEAFSRQIETWEGEAKADKEIGGDNFDANMAVAVSAIEAFGDGDLKAILNESGLGSHPAVIKFAVKAGASIKDAPVIKTNDGAAKKSFAETMYPNKE